MKLRFKQPIIHGSLPSLPSLFISIGPFLSSFCPQLLLTSLHDLYSDSHFNYCSFFYLKAPSCICFSICSLLRPLISVCFRLSPFFLLMWVQTASCGPCVFFFFAPWATCFIMWKSFTRGWSFIHRYRQLSQLFKGFAKPLRRKKEKKKCSILREVQLGSFGPHLPLSSSLLSFWKHSVSLSYFLPLSLCNFIIFHTNASSASSEHLCGEGRWNSGAISLFQDKENFHCANTPPLART